MGRHFSYRFCDENLNNVKLEVIVDDDGFKSLTLLKKELKYDHVIENEWNSPDEVDYFYSLETVMEKIKAVGSNYNPFQLLEINALNFFNSEDEILSELYQLTALLSAALRHNQYRPLFESHNTSETFPVIRYITFKYCQ